MADWLKKSAAGVESLSPGDKKKWETYVDSGGYMNFPTWKKMGMPTQDVRPTGLSTGIANLLLPGETPAMVSEAYRQYTDSGGTLDQMSWLRAGRPEALPSEVKTKTEETTKLTIPSGFPQTYTDASGAIMTWDETQGQYVQTGFAPTEVYQGGYQQPTGQAPVDNYGRQATWDANDAQWNYPPDWNVDPATQGAGYISPYEQAMLNLQQQQLSQQQAQQAEMINWYREQQQMQMEAEKQAQLAQLRANPASWLEYASLSGTTPAVQPWMVPLQTPGAPAWQAGQALPGYSATGESMNLPQLTTPSAQYMSRIAPSARQQYGGYEQARTGATPEDVQWRLWQGAPPSGTFGGLSRMR